MDTNHFFCSIEKASNEASTKNADVNDIFQDLKMSLVRNDPKIKAIQKSVISYNYNVKNQLDIKINENSNKSAYNVKKNNFFKNINSSFTKKEENKYVDSSNIYSESFDNSNKPINNTNREKRIDSMEILK